MEVKPMDNKENNRKMVEDLIGKAVKCEKSEDAVSYPRIHSGA